MTDISGAGAASPSLTVVTTFVALPNLLRNRKVTVWRLLSHWA